MKNNIVYIIGLISCVVLITILFLVSIKQNPVVENFILIDGKGQTIGNIEVKDIAINPGSSSNTTINLSSIVNGKYNINISFNEEKTSILKEYINISIVVEDKIIHEALLNDMIKNNTIVKFDNHLKKGAPLKINIIYTISKDVGNEIEGKDLKLNIKLVVNKLG